ncbi:ligase-associated DNA damage response endonuclease PdeM [Chitinophagaceae bacterium LWZ2-11]
MFLPIPHKIFDHTFWLSPSRSIFWEEEKSLIVSDLHLGKTGHFRKNGIAVPQAVYKEDLQRLTDQIIFHKAERLIVVGDMFHSRDNKELELFRKLRNDLSALHICLIRGNHDILEDNWYASANIQLHEHLDIGAFSFVHDIEDINEIPEAQYFFSGHIHPGVRINGLGKQSLSFPCFYFGNRYAILPAFGKFTGIAVITPQKNDKVYAITPGRGFKEQEKVILL